MKKIIITSATKKRIGLTNYDKIEGLTREQRILCAMIVQTFPDEAALEAGAFAKLYLEIVNIFFDGVNSDIGLETVPYLKDSNLLNDAVSLKGIPFPSFKEKETILKISNLISMNDKEFENELDEKFTLYKEKPLRSVFFP